MVPLRTWRAWRATRTTLVREIVNATVMSWVMPKRLRAPLLRIWGADVAPARISAGCFFGGTDIRIGASYLNRRVFLDNTARISIGHGCHIGMETLIVTSTHQVGPPTGRAGTVQGRPVTIGDGCWVGARATVLPGVSIAPGCIVAAGAVVTSDCAPNGVYGGVPARRLRDL
jgi:acetyltransferase-like isoleucine patch superfamily enzyme